MSHMTKLPGVPDADDALGGMAHFCGTGPASKTCGQCVNRGYDREVGNEGKVVTYGGCKVYLRLMQMHGPSVRKHWRSCRYFEEIPKSGHIDR